MSDTVDLRQLPEPIRFEAAKSEVTAFMGQVQRDLGLSDTLAVSVLECVLGEQRGHLCSMLTQQNIAYANTLSQTKAELEQATKTDETKE